jgi:hypothetical protein
VVWEASGASFGSHFRFGDAEPHAHLTRIEEPGCYRVHRALDAGGWDGSFSLEATSVGKKRHVPATV